MAGVLERRRHRFAATARRNAREASMLDGVMLLWFVLTAAALLFVAIDIRTTPESPVLKWGFVLLTAYTGVIGAFLYVLGCREPLPGLHEQYVAARWRQTLGSTMHCVASRSFTAFRSRPAWPENGRSIWRPRCRAKPRRCFQAAPSRRQSNMAPRHLSRSPPAVHTASMLVLVLAILAPPARAEAPVA